MQRIVPALLAILLVGIGAWAWRSRQRDIAAAGPASVSITYLGAEAQRLGENDSAARVSFKICNNGYQPITRVEFAAELGGTRHTFTADTVLAQARCADLTWEGRYLLSDSVRAVVTAVRRDGR